MKRLDSPYLPGRRSDAWRKRKVEGRQELVVGGWLPGQAGLTGRLGSLLVGYYDDDHALCFAGRVGSGISGTTRDDLEARLAKIPRKSSPFAAVPALPDPHWVTPKLVVEVAVPRVDERGRAARAAIQGPADRQGRARGHPRAMTTALRLSRAGWLGLSGRAPSCPRRDGSRVTAPVVVPAPAAVEPGPGGRGSRGGSRRGSRAIAGPHHRRVLVAAQVRVHVRPEAPDLLDGQQPLRGTRLRAQGRRRRCTTPRGRRERARTAPGPAGAAAPDRARSRTTAASATRGVDAVVATALRRQRQRGGTAERVAGGRDPLVVDLGDADLVRVEVEHVVEHEARVLRLLGQVLPRDVVGTGDARDRGTRVPPPRSRARPSRRAAARSPRAPPAIRG